MHYSIFLINIDSNLVMTDEELQQMQDDLLQRIWMVTLENDVYERYLTRHDPPSIKSKRFDKLN